MPHGTNIPNPMPHGTKPVHADIDVEVFNYFFRELFTGVNGPRQAMIATFFKRFYDACKAEGICGDVDDMENLHEAKVAEMLSRLNFNLQPSDDNYQIST